MSVIKLYSLRKITEKWEREWKVRYNNKLIEGRGKRERERGSEKEKKHHNDS